jgi:hypothetical protein
MEMPPKNRAPTVDGCSNPLILGNFFYPQGRKLITLPLYLGISPVGSNVLKVERLPAVLCGVSRMLGSPRGGQKLRFLVSLQKFATPKIVLSNYTPHKQKGERCPKTGCP